MNSFQTVANSPQQETNYMHFQEKLDELKRGSTVTMIPALVDTGFSGYLCLSKWYIDQLEMNFKFVERYELA